MVIPFSFSQKYRFFRFSANFFRQPLMQGSGQKPVTPLIDRSERSNLPLCAKHSVIPSEAKESQKNLKIFGDSIFCRIFAVPFHENESLKYCGNSSVGRARPCQGRGREFESRFPLQTPRSNAGRFCLWVYPCEVGDGMHHKFLIISEFCLELFRTSHLKEGLGTRCFTTI